MRVFNYLVHLFLFVLYLNIHHYLLIVGLYVSLERHCLFYQCFYIVHDPMFTSKFVYSCIMVIFFLSCNMVCQREPVCFYISIFTLRFFIQQFNEYLNSVFYMNTFYRHNFLCMSFTVLWNLIYCYFRYILFYTHLIC